LEIYGDGSCEGILASLPREVNMTECVGEIWFEYGLIELNLLR
jgi:hypothetical protein